MSGLLLADTAAEVAGLWGAVGSLAFFVLSRIGYDLCERWIRRARLKHALVMECFGTIRKVGPVLDHLRQLATVHPANTADRLGFVIGLPSRVTFAGISPELQQLLVLLPKTESSDLLRFTDRWSRLLLLVAKYEGAYDAALQSAAKCDGSLVNDRVREEYVSQALTTLNDCYWLGNSLCEVACKIIRKYGPHQDCDLKDRCDGIWDTWPALRKSWDQFTQESGNRGLFARA
jgi:hypothetical protein